MSVQISVICQPFFETELVHMNSIEEATWHSCQRVRHIFMFYQQNTLGNLHTNEKQQTIQRFWVQVPFCKLAAVVLGSPEFIPRAHLEITNWFLFCQLGFLTFSVQFDQTLSKNRMTPLSGSHNWDPYWSNRGIYWMQTTFHDFPTSFLPLPVWTLQIHISCKMHCKPVMQTFCVILCYNELLSNEKVGFFVITGVDDFLGGDNMSISGQGTTE